MKKVFNDRSQIEERTNGLSSRWSSGLSIAFSCVGHAFSHLVAPIFYVVALALEKELDMTHGEIVALIVAGNLLFGLAAPAAGWIGDRWSAVGMMTLFFLGTGGGMLLTGFAVQPWQIGAALAVTGLFASIYHPVGMAWLVRNAVNRGTALGINGVFGNLGPAAAALVAGSLIHFWGWRAAFIVPGFIVMATGAVFMWFVLRGLIVETKSDILPTALPSRTEQVRAFMVLIVTVICSGLIYQSTQSGMPKLLSLRLSEFFDGGVFGPATMVSAIYGFSAVFQVLAGRLADRYPLKYVYIGAWCLQVPLLWLAAQAEGGLLVAVVALVVTANTALLPAENTLVAKYAPSRWRGLAYGLKFIITFGLAGLGVLMEGRLFDLSGDFVWLFTILGALAAVAVAVAFMLPEDEPRRATVPAE